MTYIIIGIAAIVVIGGIAYLIYRKRATRWRSGQAETASATVTAPPEVASKATAATMPRPPQAKPAAGQVMPPLIHELSSLPEDAQTKLMNAVWYRCENPRCNYTQFLDVHHIVAEVEGGTNRLDNLIVLCPQCHRAADNHEIPEATLRSWIVKRAQRFGSELDWPYK